MQNNEEYSGFDLTMYNLFTLLREMYYTRGETETNFLQKSGGVVSGSLTIQGNLVINGQSYTIDTENLKVGDYTITLAKDNEQTLTSMVGMVVPKYDGTNYGFFGWDADGYAYVGDLTNYDGSSAITLANNSSLQKISTIDTTNTVVASNGVIYVYDATSHCFKKPTVDNKYYVIRNGAFVETELFTEQKSKNISNALYHLGAFDSEDGTTRQTGYIDLGSLSWTEIDTNCWQSSVANFPNIITSGGGKIIVGANYQSASVNDYAGFIRLGVGYIGMLSTYTYIVCMSNGKPTGFAQYKLATSYTEEIIPNQPILNLDSNMANKIRQKVVDGLNLLPNSDNVTLVQDVYYNLPLPRGTYTISTSNYQNSGQFLVVGSKIDNSNVSVLANLVNTGGTATFTITQDNYQLQRFYVQRSTTCNIMLNKGSHSYPYSKYNQKEHITNDEATLLKQEEEKCRNLLNPNNKIETATITTNGVIATDTNNEFDLYIVPVQSGINYSANYGTVYAYYSSYPSINSSAYGSTRYTDGFTNRTAPINGYVAIRVAKNTTNIMFNEGSEAKPYQEWNGEIVHKVDIEPVLLWENSSPTSAFSNGSIAVKDMSNFKYVVVEYQLSKTTTGVYSKKYKKAIGTDVYINENVADNYYRNMNFDSNTQLSFGYGYDNSNGSNDYIIPIAIYGTNIL